MADIAIATSATRGLSPHSPTLPQSGLTTKVRAGGQFIVLKDSTIYAPDSRHSGSQRQVIQGSNKVRAEGSYIARKGDALADGDIIDEGFSKVNVG